MADPEKNPVDGFFKLKHIGYCMSQPPPEGSGFSFADYVRNAKFQLCEWRGYLMEDPIWDKYSDEQILIEYYATLFAKNEEARKEFEAGLAGGKSDYLDDFSDWAEKQSAKNKKIPEPPKEEEFEFTPPTLG